MTIPDDVQDAFDTYKGAAENLRDFREEVGNILEKNDEMTRQKTTARRILDGTILKYHRDHTDEREFFDGLVSIHHDVVLEIKDETLAITAILNYCKTYEEEHGVNMVSSFLKIILGTLKDKLISEPEKFGLIDISDERKHWISPAFEIETVTKVTVSNSV